MYSSSAATSHSAPTPRRVKPLPKRRRTDSISSSVPSNTNLNHYYYSSASPNHNTHTYNSLPLPLSQNLTDLHSLPPIPPNLPPTPPIPSLLPISDELLTQWRDYCLPLLGSAADALLSAGGLGGQVYSGGRSGNPASTTGIDRDETVGGSAGGEPNPPNPLSPFSQLTPQVASQLTAQLESFVSLASAAVGATSGGTGGGSQPESSANFTNTSASSGGSPSLSSTTQAPPPQLDPVTAAAYFTHHLNASLRAAGLTGPFPPTPPPVSMVDPFYSGRPRIIGGDKGRASNGTSAQPLPSHDDRVLEAGEVGGVVAGESDRDYREDDLDDRDDRANGRNNTKKRKVPGLFSRSGVMNGDGTERVLNGLPIDISGGKGLVDPEGNRIREIEYTGELGRGNRGTIGHESRRLRARPTMSRVTMAGIQHKTRKRQLASVLLRGVNENAPNNASTMPTTSGVQNEGAKVKSPTGATTASVSTELALDQMLSDLTGLGLYSYPSLGLPPGTGTATEKPKVKVRLSKRKDVRMARKAASQKEDGGGGNDMGGKSTGKANKENDVPPPPASGTGKKKKGKGSGARPEPQGDTGEAKDGGSGERGILVPKCNFTFTCRNATSGRLQATKEQVKLLRSRFEAELARQTVKLAGEAKLRANESGADGRVGKKRVTSTTGNAVSAGATTTSTSTATATSNVESASQPPTPSKNVNKKKKKKRSTLANASNPHHLRNYVPSRVPGIGNTNNHQANANANVNDANELGPLPQQFLSAEIRSKKRGGKSDSNAFVSSAPNFNLTNPAEEWICAFCEYELFYGDDADFRKAVRKRKAVLRRRKRAREKAADKASGEASRRVRERQKELEKEQMNQQAQSTSTGRSQGLSPNPNDLDGDLESEGYNEDEYDQEDEDEDEDEAGYVENVGQAGLK